jgi:hypothetical protein
MVEILPLNDVKEDTPGLVWSKITSWDCFRNLIFPQVNVMVMTGIWTARDK